MKIVGLTGGIGSGKSTVATMFRNLGIPVYNSDEEAKRLMHTSNNLKQGIIALLGKESYDNGELDRSYIAQKVFRDKNLLEALNALVHPEVRRHFMQWVQKQNSKYVIQEAAIIFENGSHERYDEIILVTAPLATRIARVVQRDGITEEQVMERVKNQWEDHRKADLSHYVIENSDLGQTASQVAEIHRKLLKINA